MTMSVVERMTAPRPPPRMLSRKMAASEFHGHASRTLDVAVARQRLTKRFVDHDVGQQEDDEDPMPTPLEQTHHLGRIFPFLFVPRCRQHCEIETKLSSPSHGKGTDRWGPR